MLSTGESYAVSPSNVTNPFHQWLVTRSARERAARSTSFVSFRCRAFARLNARSSQVSSALKYAQLSTNGSTDSLCIAKGKRYGSAHEPIELISWCTLLIVILPSLIRVLPDRSSYLLSGDCSGGARNAETAGCGSHLCRSEEHTS